MGAAIGILITLGVMGGYLYLNWFLATRIAGLLADRFAKDNDDEIIGMDEDRGMGRSVWTPVTRGGQRFKYWLFLLVVPVLAYLNYTFASTIWTSLESTANALARFAAQFL